MAKPGPGHHAADLDPPRAVATALRLHKNPAAF
jgi:hypothetical protein